MSPCLCIDDTNGMFRVIRGAYYWEPIIEKTINIGDIVYYQKSKSGYTISLTDDLDKSIIFLTKEDFFKYFEKVTTIRNRKIDLIIGTDKKTKVKEGIKS